MTEPGIPNLFISYAREDIEHAKALYGYLKPLIVSKKLNVFFDTESIEKGTSWVNEIKRQLQIADAFIFLISRHYFESDFIVGRELPLMVRRYRDENKRCWPFCISNYPWEDFEFEGVKLSNIHAIGPFDLQEHLVPLNSLNQHQQELQFRHVYDEIRKWVETYEHNYKRSKHIKTPIKDIEKQHEESMRTEFEKQATVKLPQSVITKPTAKKEKPTPSTTVNLTKKQLVSVKYLSIGLLIFTIGFIFFLSISNQNYNGKYTGPLTIQSNGTARSIFIKGINNQYSPGMSLPYGKYDIIFNDFVPNDDSKRTIIDRSKETCDELDENSFPISFTTKINHTPNNNINIIGNELKLVNHSRKYITLLLKPDLISTVLLENIDFACDGNSYINLYTNNSILNFYDSTVKQNSDNLKVIRNYFRHGIGYMDHAKFLGYCRNKSNSLDEMIFETNYASENKHMLKRLTYSGKQNREYDFILKNIGQSADLETVMDCDDSGICSCNLPGDIY